MSGKNEEGFAEEGVGRARKGFEPKSVERGEMTGGPEWPPPGGVAAEFSFTTPHDAQTRAFFNAHARRLLKETLTNVSAVWLRGGHGGRVEVLVEMEVTPGDRRWFRAVEERSGAGLSYIAEAAGVAHWREVIFEPGTGGGERLGETYGEIRLRGILRTEQIDPDERKETQENV